ncbi:hypothetical protein EYF80_030665 [Liparis tanakae]|uniref:Uncharacterized protein n=1 Tax=Liparis tanakae TaxID=230148 RepID=A0A4Z2H0K6_9TELE|nr:hypothetical protein EYF80_030665 [Liparis tanakae]
MKRQRWSLLTGLIPEDEAEAAAVGFAPTSPPDSRAPTTLTMDWRDSVERHPSPRRIRPGDTSYEYSRPSVSTDRVTTAQTKEPQKKRLGGPQPLITVTQLQAVGKTSGSNTSVE